MAFFTKKMPDADRDQGTERLDVVHKFLFSIKDKILHFLFSIKDKIRAAEN